MGLTKIFLVIPNVWPAVGQDRKMCFDIFPIIFFKLKVGAASAEEFWGSEKQVLKNLPRFSSQIGGNALFTGQGCSTINENQEHEQVLPKWWRGKWMEVVLVLVKRAFVLGLTVSWSSCLSGKFKNFLNLYFSTSKMRKLNHLEGIWFQIDTFNSSDRRLSLAFTHSW